MQVKKTTITADTLAKYVSEKPKKVFDNISPSQLGGCMRSHYWNIRGVEQTTPPSPTALVNFEVGHAWEAMLAKAYESQGTLVKWYQDGIDKPWVDKETGIGGMPDFLVENEEGKVIVDSKTVNSAFFRYARGSFSDWVAGRTNEIYQQVAYVYLARLQGHDVNRAVLSYASKDDGFVGMEFEVDVSDELLEKVLGRARQLKGYLDREELPPCDCSGWKVGYCGFGNPATRKPNSKKKTVNTECCQTAFVKEK